MHLAGKYITHILFFNVLNSQFILNLPVLGKAKLDLDYKRLALRFIY